MFWLCKSSQLAAAMPTAKSLGANALLIAGFYHRQAEVVILTAKQHYRNYSDRARPFVKVQDAFCIQKHKSHHKHHIYSLDIYMLASF